MRKLRRPAVTPPTLTALGKGGRQAADDVRARTADPAAPLSFEGREHWRELDVLGALLAMHGRVCAYCQCSLDDTSEVEHFRPKSVYWWLAYDFSNYLLSCSRCNQKKGKVFPRPPGCGPWSWAERHRLGEEKFLLLDPVADEVERMFRLKRRQKTLFYMAPAKALSPEESLRAETSIRHLKLNFSKLVRQRSNAISGALKALEHALQGDPEKTKEARRMASRFRPYGAAIRQTLAAKYPWVIPTPEEDLKGLVVDLLADLSAADASLAEDPQSKPDKRARAEVLWALAVLWKDPPAASSALIEKWLLKAKRRDEVAALLAQL